MARRYVAGHENGKAVFVVEDDLPGHVFEHTPGLASFRPWSTAPGSSISMSSQVVPDASTSPYIPAPGGTSFLILHVPCDSVFTHPEFDADKSQAEWEEHVPGILETYEADEPGMHRTDTVDYYVLVDGELTLELDERESRTVRSGDVVVMNGTRHAWRNLGAKPAILIAILIGATRIH